MIRAQAVVVPWTPAPVFDGRMGRTFEITLAGDTTPVFTRFQSGILYTFSVAQDGAGGHLFSLPANVEGFADISTVPHTRTVQVCVAQKGGRLLAAKVAGLIGAP